MADSSTQVFCQTPREGALFAASLALAISPCFAFFGFLVLHANPAHIITIVLLSYPLLALSFYLAYSTNFPSRVEISDGIVTLKRGDEILAERAVKDFRGSYKGRPRHEVLDVHEYPPFPKHYLSATVLRFAGDKQDVALPRMTGVKIHQIIRALEQARENNIENEGCF